MLALAADGGEGHEDTGGDRHDIFHDNVLAKVDSCRDERGHYGEDPEEDMMISYDFSWDISPSTHLMNGRSDEREDIVRVEHCICFVADRSIALDIGHVDMLGDLRFVLDKHPQ